MRCAEVCEDTLMFVKLRQF